VEGRTDPGVLNHLKSRWEPDARIEAAQAIQQLTEHPGWHLLEQIVDEFEERGDAKLHDLRHEAAMAATVERSVKYAQARGTQSGMTFHRDVVRSVIASAERAADELRKRQREAGAEEGGS
jgi:uncharacterized protein YdaU (DUF1376 family)